MGTFDTLFYSKIMQVGSYFTFLVIIWLNQFLKCLTINIRTLKQISLIYKIIEMSINFKLFNLNTIGSREAYHWILYQ